MTDKLSPKYYQRGSYQVWDFIVEHELGYLEGNVIKYIVRYKDKNGLEDLKKAQTYLDKLIEVQKHTGGEAAATLPQSSSPSGATGDNQ